jgi:hypothetical protein
VFAQARDSDLDMNELGKKLASRKQELLASYKASGPPQPDLTTMDEVSV